MNSFANLFGFKEGVSYKCGGGGENWVDKYPCGVCM